jgi:hypothetical protein
MRAADAQRDAREGAVGVGGGQARGVRGDLW